MQNDWEPLIYVAYCGNELTMAFDWKDQYLLSEYCQNHIQH